MKLRSTTKNNLLNYAIVIAMFAAAQIATSMGMMTNQFAGLLIPICYYVILAVSLNLTVGILGELSLGHAGFMCVGAYSSALFTVIMRDIIPNGLIRLCIAMLIGGVVAAAFGVLIGIPVLRLRGDYLAIVTLAFGEIIKNLCNVVYLGVDKNGFHFSMKSIAAMEMDSETSRTLINGAMGISPIPRDSTFTIAFVMVLVTLFVVMNLIDSRAGRAIMSIRDNRIAAETLGISITKYKLVAFAVSAFFAGIAGTLYSHNVAFLNTKMFGYNTSIMILVYVVLGGLGSVRGSIVATVLLYVLPELLRGLRDYRMLFYAIILIVAMLINNNEKFQNLLTAVKSKIFPKKEAAE